MNIKTHLLIRTFIRLGLPALFMGGAVYLHMHHIITAQILITGVILAFIASSAGEFFFLKIPAKCPKCGVTSAYSNSMIGSIRYHCSNCMETIQTSIIQGSGPLNQDYWATQMSSVKTTDHKEFSFKRIILFTLIGGAIMAVPLLIKILS